jgi:hypothetical protein
MVLLRQDERGNEEDFLYVAGGADRQVFSFIDDKKKTLLGCLCLNENDIGNLPLLSASYLYSIWQGKCVDVRRIVVDQKSPNYLRWNELIGGQKAIHTEGDIKGQQ